MTYFVNVYSRGNLGGFHDSREHAQAADRFRKAHYRLRVTPKLPKYERPAA